MLSNPSQRAGDHELRGGQRGVIFDGEDGCLRGVCGVVDGGDGGGSGGVRGPGGVLIERRRAHGRRERGRERGCGGVRADREDVAGNGGVGGNWGAGYDTRAADIVWLTRVADGLTRMETTIGCLFRARHAISPAATSLTSSFARGAHHLHLVRVPQVRAEAVLDSVARVRAEPLRAGDAHKLPAFQRRPVGGPRPTHRTPATLVHPSQLRQIPRLQPLHLRLVVRRAQLRARLLRFRHPPFVPPPRPHRPSHPRPPFISARVQTHPRRPAPHTPANMHAHACRIAGHSTAL